VTVLGNFAGNFAGFCEFSYFWGVLVAFGLLGVLRDFGAVWGWYNTVLCCFGLVLVILRYLGWFCGSSVFLRFLVFLVCSGVLHLQCLGFVGLGVFLGCIVFLIGFGLECGVCCFCVGFVEVSGFSRFRVLWLLGGFAVFSVFGFVGFGVLRYRFWVCGCGKFGGLLAGLCGFVFHYCVGLGSLCLVVLVFSRIWCVRWCGVWVFRFAGFTGGGLSLVVCFCLLGVCLQGGLLRLAVCFVVV